MHVRFVFLDLAGDVTHYTGVASYGVAGLAALLRREGHEISLYHLTSEPDEDTFRRAVAAGAPDLIAFSANSHYARRLGRWTSWAREAAAAPVVVGGIHATLAPAEVLALPAVDHVCVGEGEEALPALCRALATGADTVGIPNLWSARGVSQIRNPVRMPVAGLDELPDPELDLFEFRDLYPVRRGYFPYLMSRGCAFRCTYCSAHAVRDIHGAGGRHWRFMAPGRAADQLARLLARHMPDARTVLFLDSIFFPRRRWLREFAPLYRDRVGLPFSCNLRADFVDEEVADLLADMGCATVRFGVESGDERMNTEVLDRGLGVEDLRRAFELTRRRGIERVAYNLVGVPEEDLRLALSTVKLNAEIQPDVALSFIFTPYPGTRLEEVCSERGLITDREFDHYMAGVVTRLPEFPPHDILFVQRFFKVLVRLYAAGRTRSPGWHDAWVRCLDAALTSRLLPRRGLVALHEGYKRLRHLVGEFLVRRSPRLYRTLGGTDPA